MPQLKFTGNFELEISTDEFITIIEQAVLGIFARNVYPSAQCQELRTFTRKEAALKLNVSPNTITKYVREGRLHSGGVGKYSFSEQNLRDFLADERK